MKKIMLLLLILLSLLTRVHAQVEPDAGSWKTWFIASVKDYRLTKPLSGKDEISQVITQQQQTDAAAWQQIQFWNAGSPGYRWQEFINKVWFSDTTYNGALANMLLNVAVYDATIAAWDTKYTFKRSRPYMSDKKVKLLIPGPNNPSYPCEHSVAAGAASTIIAHFYPKLADSVNRMAQKVMASRVAAGVAYPSDTRAGFELGKQIALVEIERTKNFVPQKPWDGKMPQEPGLWKGKPMYPLAGHNKTVVLDSGSQFRPGPPPDFAKDMAELKNYKQGFRSTTNAFYWANPTEDVLSKKMFEYNVHLDAPRAARMYAIAAIATYDGFVACWDAKYTYWGIRPDQYDTTFHPILFFTPPFPGYPSGHATVTSTMSEIYSYFFPADRAYFEKRAKDAAESRFQGGIHFRTDNEAGLQLGKKVGAYIVEKVKHDGSETKDIAAMKN